MVKKYDENSIKVLPFPTNIQTRPTMYIGALGIDGNTHLAKETIDNAVDEAMNGYGNKILIEISNKKGYCKVEDFGRGIPHNAIEKAFTNLHSSGKFDTNDYSVSSGTNGVGSKAVNALSKAFKVYTVNNGIQYHQFFENGVKKTELISDGKADKKSGTKIVFYPNPKFMNEISFNIENIKNEIEMKSYINKGLRFVFVDGDTKTKVEYYHKNGINDFITESGKLLYDPVHFVDESSIKVKDKTFKVGVEIALSHSANPNKEANIKGFCNSLYTPLDGFHVTGFKIGITSNIKKYIDSNNILTKKDAKLEITGDNIQDGLVAVVSVKYPNAIYSGQTKEKLTSTEIQGVVLKVINDNFPKWMESHSKEMKLLCNKIILSAKADAAAKRAKEAVSKKGETTISAVSDLSKLAPCIDKDPSKIELFITEGNSAASTAKGCRDKYTQAIYALRGKILNANNIEPTKIFENKELSDLIYILTGKRDNIGDKFNVENLKYNRLNILTDADTDGANIASLIITFIYQHMKDLIAEGHLYVCMPPLYSILQNGKKRYFLNQKEYDDYISDKIFNTYQFKVGNKQLLKKVSIDKLLRLLDSYNIKLEEIQNFNGINKYLLDTCVRFKINKENCTNKELLTYIKSIGDFKVFKNNNGHVELSGLFQDKFINFIFKDLVTKINDIISYIKAIKLPVNIKCSTDNEIVDLDIQKYDKLIEKVTPKSRMRFKGLGEMNSDELWDTTMNPATRNMLQVVLSDEDKTDMIQEDLFNQNTKYSDRRKVFLLKNQEKIKELYI